jgi:IS6 family transposase
VIREINDRYDPHFDYVTHVDRKYLNNRVESDHAALKRLVGYRQSFRSLSCAKATLRGMETVRTIKNGHIQTRQPRVRGEISFVHALFDLAA